MKIAKKDWKWFGHAGHLSVGQWCRFHLTTQVGNYLVSTVGEYWPERVVREIHAEVHDPAWLKANRHLKGDVFDAAYMKRFGFEEIGVGRKYETMVFQINQPSKTCSDPECGCGMPGVEWSVLAANGYNTAGEAAKGHMAMCQKLTKTQATQKEGKA